MNKRLQNIIDWCNERGVNQYLSFFKACTPDVDMYEEHTARIRYVMPKGARAAADTDEPWIADMERTIAAIDARIMTGNQA
jgi:hypothetical protein